MSVASMLSNLSLEGLTLTGQDPYLRDQGSWAVGQGTRSRTGTGPHYQNWVAGQRSRTESHWLELRHSVIARLGAKQTNPSPQSTPLEQFKAVGRTRRIVLQQDASLIPQSFWRQGKVHACRQGDLDLPQIICKIMCFCIFLGWGSKVSI